LAFVLCEIQGLDASEAAELMRVPEATVRCEAQRARVWALAQTQLLVSPGAGPRGPSDLQRAIELARTQAAVSVPTAVHRSGRAELIAAAEEVKAHSAPRLARRTVVVATLLACAALCLVVGTWLLRDLPLTYRVDGAASVVSEQHVAADGGAGTIHFSDGSEIVLEPGARVRIDGARIDGAIVVLEHGAVTMRLRQHEPNAWQFVAGPFELSVLSRRTGTGFRLDWDAQTRAIDLKLSRMGVVGVKSPLGPAQHVLQAGQRFQASLNTGTVQLDYGASGSGG
jgi:hypothetical protein